MHKMYSVCKVYVYIHSKRAVVCSDNQQVVHYNCQNRAVEMDVIVFIGKVLQCVIIQYRILIQIYIYIYICIHI
jgi:hypothetical protein